MFAMGEFAAYVYIVASKLKVLYIGVTTELEVRVFEHKSHAYPGFTAKYNVDQLVYFERFQDIQRAIAREKQLKKWSRVKKMQLVVRVNPDWRDLSLDWGQAVKPFDGKLRAPETF
jgi:putative endonuclease